MVEGRWRVVPSGGGPQEGRDGVARDRGASAGPDIRHTPQVLTVPAGGVSLYPDLTFDVLFSVPKKQVTIFPVQYMEKVRQKKVKFGRVGGTGVRVAAAEHEYSGRQLPPPPAAAHLPRQLPHTLRISSGIQNLALFTPPLPQTRRGSLLEFQF